MASMTGLRVPAAKGATVRGIKAADISLQNLLGEVHSREGVKRTAQKPNDSCHELGRASAQAQDHWLLIDQIY